MTTPDIVAVAETSDELEASLWADALRAAGLRAEVLTLGPRGALGGGVMFPGASFRVLVPAQGFGDARNIIADLGGAERLSPMPSRQQGDPMRIVWLMAAVIGAFFAGGLLLRFLAA